MIPDFGTELGFDREAEGPDVILPIPSRGRSKIKNPAIDKR